MLKFSTELIGTLLLTLAIGYSGEPLAVGFILAVLTYLCSGVSEAHFNPAVTLAAWISNSISLRRLATYLVAQASGAVAGAWIIAWLTGMNITLEPAASTDLTEFIAIDLLFALLFVLLFLYMIYPSRKGRNPVYGLMVGIAFAGCLMIAEPVTGSTLNPAISLGFMAIDYLNSGFSHFYAYAYLFAPLVGGTIAGLVYQRYG
ncbi:MAG: aquaporin [Balneolaceae bacterium]|nr:aquaporin [Balneolaceae bacterium]MCH8549627.1 aquaporin [Balneolaceae bacterium]